MQKTLLVWPSAEFSTYDVARGIQRALVKQGIELVDYLLFNRIKIYAAGFGAFKPDDQYLDQEMVYLHASEAIPYRVAINGCRWVFIVNGMGLHPNAIAAVRRMGVKVACWFTEAPYNTNKEQELGLAELVDVAFVNERTCLKQYQDVLDVHGGVVHYIPHAFDPERHRPEAVDKEIDVFFLGTGFVDRHVLFEAMDMEGINFKIGGNWAAVKEPSFLHDNVFCGCTTNEDTVQIYHKSKIVLNPHRWAIEAESANPRTYEVAACGVFQISDYRKEIEEIFGDSIPMYESGVPWQLNALIRRYLAQPERMRNMTEEARRRVQNHTFDDRAKFIISKLEEYDRSKI